MLLLVYVTCMPEYVQFLILFVVGFLSAVINVMAGGGSSLTLPTLIFLGLDGATANGTNRIAIVIQSFFAVLAFRQEKVSRLRQSLMLAVFTLPGSFRVSFSCWRSSESF